MLGYSTLAWSIFLFLAEMKVLSKYLAWSITTVSKLGTTLYTHRNDYVYSFLLILYLISGSLSLRYPRSIDFEPPLRKRSLKSTFQSCAFCAYIANMSRKKNKYKRAGLLPTCFGVPIISLLSLRFILDQVFRIFHNFVQPTSEPYYCRKCKLYKHEEKPNTQRKIFNLFRPTLQTL